MVAMPSIGNSPGISRALPDASRALTTGGLWTWTPKIAEELDTSERLAPRPVETSAAASALATAMTTRIRTLAASMVSEMSEGGVPVSRAKASTRSRRLLAP